MLLIDKFKKEGKYIFASRLVDVGIWLMAGQGQGAMHENGGGGRSGEAWRESKWSK